MALYGKVSNVSTLKEMLVGKIKYLLSPTPKNFNKSLHYSFHRIINNHCITDKAHELLKCYNPGQK